MFQKRPASWSRWSAVRDTFLLLLLSLLAVVPLMMGFPVTDDGLFHLHRLYELDTAVSEGLWYTRWAPFFANGSGFPFFNFYAPLTYYLAEALHLGGLGLADSLRVLYGLSIPLSLLGMYLLARSLWRRRWVAMLAAVLYGYAPYQMVDLYRRGALAESLALALFPFILLSYRNLVQAPSWHRAAVAAMVTAILLLTHNIMSLLFVPVLFVSLVWLVVKDRQWRSARPAALSFALGHALSAFFWLPALLERRFLNFERMSSGWFSLDAHWADSWPFWQGTFVFDFADPFRMGLWQLMLLVAGFLLWWRGGRPLAVAMPLALCVVAILMLWPFSGPLWFAVPLMPSIQFPWRLLGLVALGEALFIGSVGGRLIAYPVGSWRMPVFLALAALIGVTIFTSLGGLAPEYYQELTLNAVESSNSAAVAGWDFRARGAPSTQPALGLAIPEVEVKDLSVVSKRLITQAEGPARLTLHTLYFPGWQAYIDGIRAPLMAEGELGLLALDLPAGHHDVLLRFEDTPVRTIANGLSLAGLVILLLLAAPRRLYARPVVSFKGFALLLGAVVPLIGLAFIVMVRSPAGPAPVERYHRAAAGNADVKLVAYRVDLDRVSQGRALVRVVWQAQRSIREDYSVYVFFMDDQGYLVGEGRPLPLGQAYPASRWSPGAIVEDFFDVSVSRGVNPEQVWLKVGLAAQGHPAETLLARAQGGEGRPPFWDTPTDILAGGFTLGSDLTLLGYRLDSPAPYALSPLRAALEPGGVLAVDLYWRAKFQTAKDYAMFVHLLDGKGNLLVGRDNRPKDGRYPTYLWAPGEVVHDRFELPVPPDAPGGTYRLIIGAYPSVSQERLPVFNREGVPLGLQIGVEGFKVRPPRQEGPVGAGPLAKFGPISLQGYSAPEALSRSAGKLSVVLLWRAEQMAGRDYTVFVHLVDEKGRVWAQHDAEPRNGTYPSSFWELGELVRDEHVIAIPPYLPPGRYALRAGLYLLSSMNRLPVLEGAQGSEPGAVDLGYVAIAP